MGKDLHSPLGGNQTSNITGDLPPTSAHNWAIIDLVHASQANQAVRPPSVGVAIDAQALQAAQAAQKHLQTAAESIVQLLCGLGLSTFFGVPGGPVIPIFDAIVRNKKARLVEPRHEAYGTFSAMGYYRASGKVPVVVVTAGPGATNVVTGVVAAHLERVPMLVICGDVPWSMTGHRMLQDTGIAGVGIERMLQGVTRAVVRVAHAQSASSQVRAAVEAATDPVNPGPALVVISIDKAGAKAEPPQIYGPPLDRPSPIANPEPSLMRHVASTLRAATHPVVLVGAGCRGRRAQVMALCEALGAPVVTTPQAKGIFPETHPLSLRTCGMGGSLWSRRYLRQGADVALVLGTDLDDISTIGAPLVAPQGTIIHVDTDPSVFARNQRTSVAAAYDVGAFAAALTEICKKWDKPLSGISLAGEARAVAPFDVPDFRQDPAVPLAPHRAIADLEAAAGDRAIFVTDIGEHMIFALHYLTIGPEARFVIHLGLGSMGSGISSTIGLGIGDPSRRVVCVCGDGGMQMAGMEILVAVKMKLPVVYAVFNDARYNMVYHGYRLTFGREEGWDAPQVDFAKWAEAAGARGKVITNPGEITKALLDELTREGTPAVLDIRYNADVRVKGSGRAEAIRDMSQLQNK